jgi:hypothetical protein
MDWTIVLFIAIIGGAAYLLSRRQRGDATSGDGTIYPADTSSSGRSHDRDNDFDHGDVGDSGGSDSD